MSMSFGVAPGAVGSRRPQPFSSYSNSNVVQSQTSKIGRSLTAVKRRLLEAQQNGIAMRDQMRKELRGLKDVHDQIVTEISRSRRPTAVDAESLQATRRNSKKSSTTGAPTSSTSTAAGASAGGGALAPPSSTSSGPGAFDNYGNFFRPASRTTATVTSENIVSNLLVTEAYHKDLEASLEQDPVRTLTRPAAAGKDVISGGAGAGAVAADENDEEVLEEQPGASSTSTTAAQRRIHHPQLAGLRASLMKRHEEELAAERALDGSAAGDSEEEDDGGGNASHPLVAGQRQRPALQRKLSIDKKPTLSRRMKVNDGTTTPQKQGTSSSRGASRERRPSNVSSSVLSDGFGSERKTSGPHTAAAVRKHKQDLGGMIRDFRTNLVNFRGDGGGATGSTTGASHYLKSTTQTEHRKVAPRDLSHLQKQPHHEHMIDLRAHFHSSEIHPADRRHPDRLIASRGAAPRGGGGGGRGERGGMSSGPGSGGGGGSAGTGTAAPLLPDSNSGTLMASPLVESLRGVRRMREQLTEHTSSQKNAVSQLEESFREYFLGPEMEKMNQAFHNAESEYTEELQKIKQQKDLVVNWFMRKELEQGGEGLATQGGEYQDILRRLAVLRGEVTSLGKSMKVVDSKKLASDLEADEAELLKIVEGLGAGSSTSPGAVPVPAVAGTTTRTTTSTPSSALARSHFDVAGELESLKQQMTQFFSSGKGKQNYEYYEPELDAIRGELDSLRAEMRASGMDGVAPKSSAVPSPASAIGRNSVATAVGGGDEGQESLLGGRRPSQQTASAPPPAPPPDPLFYPELVSEQSSKESQTHLHQSMAPGRAAATAKIVMPAASSAVVEPQRVDAVGESEDRQRPVRRRGQAQTRTLMQDETQKRSQCATREHSQHELTTSDGAVHLDDGALLAHAPGNVRWFDKGVGKGGLMHRRGGTGTAGRSGVARDEDGTLTTGTSTGAGAGAGPIGPDFKSSPASGVAVEYSQLFHHDTHGRGPPSFGAPPHHQPAPLQPATTAPLLSAFESMARKQPQRRISPPPHSKRIR